MKNYFINLVLFFTTIFLSSVNAEEKPVVKIGWAGPLTGNSAVLGVDSAKVIQMVFEKANRDTNFPVKLDLIIEDDSYNTKRSIQAFNKLANLDKVPVVFFLTYGGIFAIADQALQSEIVVLDPLDCNEDIAKLPNSIICAAAMTETIGIMNANNALESGHKKAAFLYFQDDPFMATITKSTEERINQAGGKVVLSQSYPGNTTDFRSILLRAKSQGADSFYFYGYDEAAFAMKQARELGIKAQFYSTATVLSPNFIKAASLVLEGTKFSVFTPSNEKLYSQFLSDFEIRYGSKPILDIATVPTYDFANILIDFIKNYQGSFESRQFGISFKKHLFNLKNYQGASGEMTISEDGAIRTLTNSWYQVKSGKRELLK